MADACEFLGVKAENEDQSGLSSGVDRNWTKRRQGKNKGGAQQNPLQIAHKGPERDGTTASSSERPFYTRLLFIFTFREAVSPGCFCVATRNRTRGSALSPSFRSRPFLVRFIAAFRLSPLRVRKLRFCCPRHHESLRLIHA